MSALACVLTRHNDWLGFGICFLTVLSFTASTGYPRGDPWLAHSCLSNWFARLYCLGALTCSAFLLLQNSLFGVHSSQRCRRGGSILVLLRNLKIMSAQILQYYWFTKQVLLRCWGLLSTFWPKEWFSWVEGRETGSLTSKFKMLRVFDPFLMGFGAYLNFSAIITYSAARVARK